jgi:hypothetical protein
MANRKVEEQLEALGLMRDADSGEAVPALRKALAGRVNVVTAKAAKIAAERQFRELVPDLLRAFDRLFENAAERDPQCWGKNAIAGALRDLEYRESASFLRGARHIQMEKVWGGQEDTAQTLRGICLLSLVACTDVERGDVLRCLVSALTEKAHTIRLEAVRALAQMEGDECALLLRLKARMGDEEPQVTGQVFDGLLRLEGERALPFLGDFLRAGSGAVCEEAAMALGASRLAGAVGLLQESWKTAKDAQFREVLLRAASVSRQERALGWLLELVRCGRTRDAVSALEALALQQAPEDVRRRIEEAATGREAEVAARFEGLFRR